MTTSHERTRSVIQTRTFLKALCSSHRTAGVPADVRREALRLLTHYPEDIHLDHAAIAWPEMWAPLSPQRADAPSYLELIVSLRELTGESPDRPDARIEPASGEPRDEDLTTLSKNISRILRHRPDAAGVSLDRHGWCEVDDLLQGLARVGMPATREVLEQVVRSDDKQRFVLDGNRIRAAQGHSTSAVEPLLRPKKPPSRLFHGTVAASLPGIERKGLLPMRRHHVHLSPDEETARAVGRRRGAPVVLVVDAARMARDGHQFFVSDNGVWLTDAVPPKYLSRGPST